MLMDAESSKNDDPSGTNADVSADISAPQASRKRKASESASEESDDKSDSVLDTADDSDAGTEEPPPPPARHSKLTPYELAREQRKKDIAELMETVGLNQAAREFNEASKVPKKKRQKRRKTTQECPTRPSQTAQDDPAEDSGAVNSMTLPGRLYTNTDMDDSSGGVGNMMGNDVNGDVTAGNTDAGLESGAPDWVIDATTYLRSFELGCGWKESVDNWLRVEKTLAWGQKVSCVYSRNTKVYNRFRIVSDCQLVVVRR